MSKAIAGKLSLENVLDQASSGQKETIHMDYIAPSKCSCERQLTLHLANKDYGINHNRSGALETYARIGYAVEDYMLSLLDKSNSVIDKAVKFNLQKESGVPLYGKLDAIIKLNDTIYGLEIKSTKELPKDIEPQHIAQIQLYAAITGLPFQVLYASRNPIFFGNKPRYVSFAYQPSLAGASDRLARMYFGWQCSKNNLLPDIPFEDRKNKTCEYCVFADMCWDRSVEDLFDSNDAKYQQLVDEAFEWSDKMVANTADRRKKLLSRYNLPT